MEGIANFIKKHLLQPLAHSYIFIGFCSIALYWATKVQLHEKIVLNATVLLIFFSTILIYIFNRLLVNIAPVHSINDFLNLVLQKFQNSKIKLSVLFLFVVIAYLCIYIKYDMLLLFAFASIISFAYMIPLLKVNKRMGGLRTLGLLKINLVAFVWATVTVSIACLENNVVLLSNQHLVLFFERYLFIFVLTVPFDIRDKYIDQSRDVNTIPVLLGIKKTKQVNYLVLLILSVFLVFQYGLFSREFLVFAHLNLIIAILTYYSTVKRGTLYYLLIVDGMMIYYSICLYLVHLC